MTFDYYNLPFGAQLLLWTSRVSYNGSCRTKPNKYELINMAYTKVGIDKGALLLLKLLSTLKKVDSFKLQFICSRYLNDNEINLINCIEVHKKKTIDNKHYIKIWGLENNKNLFTLYSLNLANAFKKVNLDTDLNSQEYKSNNFNISNQMSKILH